MAVVFSLALIIFFSVTRMFHTFNFGMLDFIFILLPVGVLGLKSLLTLLATSGNDENLDTTRFLAAFFMPFLKIFRDWFPFLLLCACYYALYSNLILRVNPHLADAELAKIDGFILGNQPSFLLQPFIRPWLTNFLYAVYFSHVVAFPGVALYFYLKKEEQAFRRIMMGFLTIMLLGTMLHPRSRRRAGNLFCRSIYHRPARTSFEQKRGLHYQHGTRRQRLLSVASCRHSSVAFILSASLSPEAFHPGSHLCRLDVLRHHLFTLSLSHRCHRRFCLCPGSILVERFSAGKMARRKNPG
jgi:hypothetical protein